MFIGNSSTWGRLAILMIAIVLVATQSLFAATSGVIKGKVLDKNSGDPLIGANVVVLNTSLGGSTNIDGLVTIYGVPEGEQTLKISYVGYETITVNVTIVEDGVIEQEYRLSPQAIEGEEVVITAQARGQNQAINQQIASKTMVNVVSAEKMKELPDANIAESIGRLPGVSLQRNAGEANAVVVRGMSPKYNAVTIEGVPMVSTYFGDRGIDLSVLSDDMVKGVEVSKTLRPDMDADAIGGTVNLTLKSAEEGFHFDVRGHGGYTELDNSFKNFKLAATVSDRFLDNKLGVLFQGNIEGKRLPSDQFNAGYNPPQGENLIVGADTVRINNMSTSTGTLTKTDARRNRYGASLMLDYLTDFVNIKFYTVYDQKNDSSLIRSNQWSFANNQYLYQIFANETKTEQRTHSLQFLFKLGNTELPISLSYTRGDVSSPNAQQIDIYGFKTTGTPASVAMRNFAQPSDLMNYMGVQEAVNSLLQQPWMIHTSLRDISYDLKADWKIPYTLSDKMSGILTVGGKYHNVDRSSDRNQYGLYIQYGQGADARNGLIEYLTNKYPGFTTDRTLQTGIQAHNFADVNYTGGDILGYTIGQQYDVGKLLETNKEYYALHGPEAGGRQYLLNGITSYNQDYTDKEETYAAYIMTELNIGQDLTVIPGVRYEQYKTDISAYQIIVDPLSPLGTSQTPVSHNKKRDNSNWFPSINIKYKATENINVLGAAYRSTSLPSFIEIAGITIMNSGGIFLPNGDRRQISSGNPLVKPSTAVNFDIGASYIDKNFGLFTINLFYKEISDLIYNMNNYYPYMTGLMVGAPDDIMDRLPDTTFFNSSWVRQITGEISTNIPMNNPEKAYLRGIELSWQTQMWYLPGVLSGIVLDLNASFMSSKQLYPYFEKVRTGGTVVRPVYSLFYRTRSGQLQDQPKAIYNAILGWDYKGFSSRFSLRYQKTTLTGLDTQYDLRDAYYDDLLLVDISLKQKITPDLAIFADVKNLTSHVDKFYLNYYNGNNGTSGRLPTSEQTYGLSAQLGFSYTY